MSGHALAKCPVTIYRNSRSRWAEIRISGPALLFRFTERDLSKEDKEARKLTRYIEQDGDWVPVSQCATERLKS